MKKQITSVKLRYFDDWKVNSSLFLYIDSLWGPHSVDCFASIENRQLPIFYSRFWCPGTSEVDAFTVNWAGDVNWWVPPMYLVGITIQHAEACKAMGILIIPAWKSAPVWPLLYPDGCHLASFVHDCRFIPL